MFHIRGMAQPQRGQLQRVVAHEQRTGANHAGLAFKAQLQRQHAAAAQQCAKSRQQGHDAVAAKTPLRRLALLQQARVQAHAGVDQKNAFTQQAHGDRLFARRQQSGHAVVQIGRHAVRAPEVVEGALGQHAHQLIGVPDHLGHGVQRAVAARSDHAAVRFAGGVHGAHGGAGQVVVAAHGEYFVRLAGGVQQLMHARHGAVAVGGAGSGVEDDEQGWQG